MAERIDLNLMHVFDALMRERSVSRAADRLGMGQPATSAALNRLRKLFNDELFVRGPVSMAPTARATDAHIDIRDALETVARAVESGASFDPRTERRVFHINGSDYAAMTVLPQLYEAVRREAPSVDLRFRSVEGDGVFGLLDGGELDLAIGAYPRAPKSLARSELLSEGYMCLVRRDHPGLKEGLSLDLFCSLPHILVAERGADTGAVDSALHRVGRSRRVALTVPHLLTVPVLVAGSDSIATVGRRVAAMCCHAFHRLDALVPPVQTAEWELSQIWARRRSGDAGLDWLRGMLHRIASHSAPGARAAPPAP